MQVGSESYLLRNPNDKSRDRTLLKKKSMVNFRLEDVEQTNKVIQLQFMVKGFDARKIQFRLNRARSMGEFYPFYHSPVIANEKVAGCKWEVTDFFFKEICRNDLERTLKIEFFEIKLVKESE